MKMLTSSQRWCLSTLLGALLTVSASAPASAQSLAGAAVLNLAAARAVTQQMDGDARLQGVFRTCPADTFRREAAGRSRFTRAGQASLPLCLADPTACHDACARDASGAHCFSLARAFQESERAIPQRYAQMMFSMACAAGYGAGCTNRAASIRNSLHEGDPFQGASEAAKEDCQFRSFRIACRQDDAWGCAMLGQSYQLGEGVARSAPLARGAFQKSCQISPRFEACSFARAGLREQRR